MHKNITSPAIKKESSFTDLFKFLYDFTSMDMELFLILARAPSAKTLEELAVEVDRDKSTVFRCVQKLVIFGLARKDTKNLREGGYFHLYSSSDMASIRKITRAKVEEVRDSLDLMLDKFDKELEEITSSRHLRILVAEDNKDIASSYRFALEDRGHEVDLAYDGKECLSTYSKAIRPDSSRSTGLGRETPFDVVILDYKMPKVNGMDCAREILKLNPQQRIIFASAYVKETLVESIKELKQIVELVQKPFDAKALIETVEDREAHENLKRLATHLENLDIRSPDSEKVSELLGALRVIQKGRTF